MVATCFCVGQKLTPLSSVTSYESVSSILIRIVLSAHFMTFISLSSPVLHPVMFPDPQTGNHRSISASRVQGMGDRDRVHPEWCLSYPTPRKVDLDALDLPDQFP
jgi:hypothetical protein